MEMNSLRRMVLGDGLRRTARRFPNKSALVFHYSDGRTLCYSYKELDTNSNRIANALIDMGIKKDDKVAVMSHNSPQLVNLIWALTKIGAWYTPINFMLGSREIEYIINFSEAKVFFIEDDLLEKVLEIKDKLPSVKYFGYVNLGGKQGSSDLLDLDVLMQDASDKYPQAELESENIATLAFTSGTEAAPKGVFITHGNYYAYLMANGFSMHFSSEDVDLLSVPLIHMAGLALTIGLHLIGATIVMTQLPNPAQMVELIEKYRVTMTHNPPTIYVAMTNTPGFSTRDFTSARKFISWASTIPQSMINAWGEVAPNVEWFTTYGSSESSAAALTGSWFKTFGDIPNCDGTWIGKATAATSELVLVDDDGNEVKDDEVGELVVRGPVLMRGYYKNEEATRKAFKNDWFHTGDLLRKDGRGNYYFVDRKKDMIKSGGENVSSQEVENVISSHPAVLQCAVFAVPHSYWGEAVAAAIIPKTGVDITEAEIISHCKNILAGYKIPKYLFFRDSLPTTASGKLYKQPLRSDYKDAETQSFQDDAVWKKTKKSIKLDDLG